MKKLLLKSLSVLLICFTLFTSAESSVQAVQGFTHPEIGEFLIYHLDNNQPFFTVYGFVQYKIMDPSKPYRGILSSTKKKATSFELSMSAFFDSIEGKSKEPVPVVFEYTGILADYSYILDSLPKEDKIQAIKLIAGFDGIKGFTSLKKIKGLEDFDSSYLEEMYEEYTIDIAGRSYPYRVLMFFIEEEDWQESYYERYDYIKDGRNWKLIQIAKEYASEYRQRNKYIHGLPGSTLSDYDLIAHDAMRGATWFTSQEDLVALENLSAEGKQLSVEGTSVFRLPANLTYTYSKKDWLSKIEYTLQNAQAYYSAFVSLYIRYYDPINVSADGTISWSLPDTQIELIYDDSAPIIRFTPRIDQDKASAG